MGLGDAVFGSALFGDAIWASMGALDIPPVPVVTVAGDGDMIPLEFLTDDEEALLMLAAVLR